MARATPEAENLLPAALEQARAAGACSASCRRWSCIAMAIACSSISAPAAMAATWSTAVSWRRCPIALALGVLADNGRASFDAALQALRAAMPPPRGWGNPWSRAARARFALRPAPPLLLQDADGDVPTTLSQRVWLPLRAAPASLWGRDDKALRVDCCLVARLDDWMRLGDLLLGQGSYEGERIASPDWMRQLLPVDANGRAQPAWLAQQAPWQGDEPPVARDAYWFDLGTDLRLWLVPRRGLAVLVWAQRSGARDTLIPNIILRGLNDQAPPVGGSGLNELVPGH